NRRIRHGANRSQEHIRFIACRSEVYKKSVPEIAGSNLFWIQLEIRAMLVHKMKPLIIAVQVRQILQQKIQRCIDFSSIPPFDCHYIPSSLKKCLHTSFDKFFLASFFQFINNGSTHSPFWRNHCTQITSVYYRANRSSILGNSSLRYSIYQVS